MMRYPEADAPRWSPLSSSLELGMRLARRLPFHLTACNGCFDAGIHPSAVGGKVSVTVRGDEKQTTRLSPIDPAL